MYLLPPRHLPFYYEKVKVCHEKLNSCDYWRPKVNDQFDLVWSNYLGKTLHTVAMDATVTILNKNTDNVIKSHKCNQCDYASSHAGHLRTHLKKHSGEKSNKCNQCDYATNYASALKIHLKAHSGEKSNECIQCDFKCSNPSSLRRHMKRHRSV